MGGAATCEGNVTAWAEANIIGDPEAASIVFNSNIPLVMVGLDVTLQTRMSQPFVNSLMPDLSPLQNLLRSINKVSMRTSTKPVRTGTSFLSTIPRPLPTLTIPTCLAPSTAGSAVSWMESNAAGRSSCRADQGIIKSAYRSIQPRCSMIILTTSLPLTVK